MTEEEKDAEKVSVLNSIFEDLVTDASDLVKDLYWGVKTYLFFGLMTILFGVQEIVYNMDVIQDRLYVPLLVGALLLFSGAAQLLNYFRLRKKYSRLFKVQSELKNA